MKKYEKIKNKMKNMFFYRYGISQLRSPVRHPAKKAATSFTALQERAKQYFNDTNSSDVSQLLEDFCRECDRHVEEEKEKMKDLQEQVRFISSFFFFHHFKYFPIISYMPFSLHENF